MNKILTIIMLFSLISVPAMAETQWEVAKGPSSIKFKVNHLVFAEVEGKFKSFEGNVQAPSDHGLANAVMRAKIHVNSLNTGNQDRDKHLNSQEFFFTNKFPEITFVSQSVQKLPQEHMYEIVGDITIRGVTKTVVLTGKCSNTRELKNGKKRMDLLVSGAINRFDFGLKWNELIETGGAIVGEQVKLDLKLALTKG